MLGIAEHGSKFPAAKAGKFGIVSAGLNHTCAVTSGDAKEVNAVAVAAGETCIGAGIYFCSDAIAGRCGAKGHRVRAKRWVAAGGCVAVT